MDYALYSGYFNKDGSESLNLVDFGSCPDNSFKDLSMFNVSKCEHISSWKCEFLELWLTDLIGHKFKFRFPASI